MAADKPDKEERATPTSRRSTEAEEKRSASERVTPRPATNDSTTAGHITRHLRYLIALRQPNPLGVAPPQSLDAVVEYLGRQEDVEIVARHKSVESQPFAPDGAFVGDVVVARMAEAKAQSLQAAAQPHVVVERDSELSSADGLPLPVRAMAGSAFLPISPVANELSLRIVSERDQPLARASVVVFGPGFPVQATTDDQGIARINLYGGDRETVRAIYVRPAANYWERFVTAPELSESGATTIRLRPLAETAASPRDERIPGERIPGERIPGERGLSWSHRLMFTMPGGNVPAAGLTGAGVRVGIIDSGCDNSHPALRAVTRGRDLTGSRGANGWTDDTLGYGTHAAGLVASVAPEAEIHAFKVCPGGRVSDLLAALDECTGRELDIVCLSAGCEVPSELLEQKLRELHHKGVACIAAAGTVVGMPAFAAVQPSALTVGAVGKLREFPPDTCHAQAILPEAVGSDGVFAAAFRGAGRPVALAAPGVAIVSTVPGGQAALDGTGIAAAHAASLACLVMAHHPLFQGPLRARGEQRVATLFGLLRASAVSYFADPLRGGAGVPNLQRVPGMFVTSDLRAATASTEPLGFGPFEQGPFQQGPFQTGPFQSGPFSPGPFSSGPFSPGPFSAGLGAFSPEWQALIQRRVGWF